MHRSASPLPTLPPNRLLARLLLVVLVLLLPLPTGQGKSADGSPEELTAKQRTALEELSQLNDKAFALLQAGKREEAIAVKRQELAVIKEAFGPKSMRFAEGLGAIAILLEAPGSYAEASELYNRAVQVMDQIPDVDRGRLSLFVRSHGRVMAVRRMLPEARALYERALQIADEVGYSGWLDITNTLHSLGQVHLRMGADAKARRSFDLALQTSRRRSSAADRKNGKSNWWRIESLRYLAYALLEQGAYGEVLPYFEEILKAEEAEPERYARNIPVTDLGYASALWQLRRYQDALPHHLSALRHYGRNLGPDHARVGAVSVTVAATKQALGKYEEAKQLYQEAIRIRERPLGPAHPFVAEIQSQLGLLAAAQENYPEALELLSSALRDTKNLLGADHPYIQERQREVAFAQRQLGKPKDAVALLKQALKSAGKIYGAGHLRLASDHERLADLLRSSDESTLALPEAYLALDLTGKSLQKKFLGLTRAERLAHARMLRRRLEAWVEVSGHAAKSAADTKSIPSDPHSAYDALLKYKTLLPRLATSERALLRHEGPDVADRLAPLLRNQRDLRHLEASPPVIPQRAFREKARQRWLEQVAKLKETGTQLAQGMGDDFPIWRAGLLRLNQTRQQVQAQLGPKEALVDTLRANGQYVAWIVRNEGEPTRVDLGPAKDLEHAAVAFATQVADPGCDPKSETWKKNATRMHELLWKKLEALLPDYIDTIYFVPGEALAALPLVALPGRSPGTFLLDDYLLVHLTSAHDLVPLKQPSGLGKTALFVGGVNYEKAKENEYQKWVKKKRWAPPSIFLATRTTSPPGGPVKPLPDTAVELKQLKAALGKTRRKTISRSDAAESRLRVVVVGKRFVHLATHGFVRDDLIRSTRPKPSPLDWLDHEIDDEVPLSHDTLNLVGTLLSGSASRDDGNGDDGVLTAIDASYLDLDSVEMVVLSANAISPGNAEAGQGLLGHVQGFQMAGARRVVASLWPSLLAARQELLHRLYVGVLKQGVLKQSEPLAAAKALRLGMVRVRVSTDKSGQPLSHPAHWAGWAAYGR